MPRDTAAVLWKELREVRRGLLRRGSLLGVALYLGYFGVFPALLIGPSFAGAQFAALFWAIVPAVVCPGLAVNAFAGERERHTLETLLASRLPDRAILWGKLAAAVLVSMGYTLAVILTSGVALNVVAWPDGPVFFTPAVLLGGLLLSLAVAMAIAAAGVLISLRSATAREAAQKLSLALLALFIPQIALGFLPPEARAAALQRVGASAGWIVVAATATLAALAAALLALAERRFRRARLLLDEAAGPRRRRAGPGAPQAPRARAEPPPARRAGPGAAYSPALGADILAVLWKEWREILATSRASARWQLLILVGLFGVIFPLQHGREWASGWFALALWAGAPLLLVTRTVADTFAGERERHTLETLLASPLSNAAILLGKLLAALLWAWGLTQLLMLAGLVTVNVAHWGGGPLLYRPAVALAGAGFGLLVGAIGATAGSLVSLRARTVQQAQQTLGIASVVVFLLPLALAALAPLLPAALRDRLVELLAGASPASAVAALAALLILAEAGLVAAALRGFRRARQLLL